MSVEIRGGVPRTIRRLALTTATGVVVDLPFTTKHLVIHNLGGFVVRIYWTQKAFDDDAAGAAAFPNDNYVTLTINGETRDTIEIPAEVQSHSGCEGDERGTDNNFGNRFFARAIGTASLLEITVLAKLA